MCKNSLVFLKILKKIKNSKIFSVTF